MGEPNNSNTKRKPRRIDFEAFAKDVSNNLGRYIPVEELNQFQDSLIARGEHDDRFNDATNLAILATSAQEMDKRGGDSRGIGGNGYMGLSYDRMPASYLGNTPEKRGEQIHYILEDLLTTHPNNWLDGGTGGPYIKNGKDGFNKFWEATDPTIATQILNKSYIRPRDREAAWNNRAKVARNMSRYMKRNGGRSLEEGRRAEYKNGGIHIDPSKRGTFTAAATKHGMTVKQFTNEVLSHPNEYSAKMRKKAHFADVFAH